MLLEKKLNRCLVIDSELKGPSGVISYGDLLLFETMTNIKVFAFSICFLCCKREIPAVLIRIGDW